MKILLTGKNGQVGFELSKRLCELGDVIAIDREDLDLENSEDISLFLDQTKPDLIIHPAAYTNVDNAESEPNLCHQINVIATEVLTKKAIELNIPIIYFSSDYVFDGLKNEPYVEDDKVNPQSIYAKTKYEGEAAVRQHKKHIILRASWVFGSHGNNFLKTILRLVQEKNALSVVSDQKGSPASATMLADVTFKIARNILNNKDFKDYGTYHVTADGETNWYSYARKILDTLESFKVELKLKKYDLHPISSAQYSQNATRPKNSKLNTDKFKKIFMTEFSHWENEIDNTVLQLFK